MELIAWIGRGLSALWWWGPRAEPDHPRGSGIAWRTGQLLGWAGVVVTLVVLAVAATALGGVLLHR